MSTLAAMKSRIADELTRSDLTNQIALAISEAVGFYQKQRFYWTERNDVTIATEADRAEYASAGTGVSLTALAEEDAFDTAGEVAFPIVYDLDDVFILIGINEYRVKRIEPTRWRLLKNSSTKGQPFQYSYFNQTIYLYPVPTQVYTIRLVGHFKIDGPASDDEAGNPWMIDAEALIRHRAKMLLYRDVILDEKQAMICAMAEKEALDMLRDATSNMTRTGQIEPMAF